MRIALAQINSHLGNFKANAQKIIDFTWRAKERRCEIVLFPEATLFGYHPMDLLERHTVVDEQLQYIKKIRAALPEGIVAIFGAFTPNTSKAGKPYFNSAIALQKSRAP